MSFVRCLRNGLWAVWWLHCSLPGPCWWRVCSKELPNTSCGSWQVPQVYLTVCDIGILMFAQMGLILHRCVHACLKWTQSFWLWTKVSNRHFPGRYSCLNWHVNGIDMIVILWVQGRKITFPYFSMVVLLQRELFGCCHLNVLGRTPWSAQLTMEGTAGQCPWVGAHCLVVSSKQHQESLFRFNRALKTQHNYCWSQAKHKKFWPHKSETRDI